MCGADRSSKKTETKGKSKRKSAKEKLKELQNQLEEKEKTIEEYRTRLQYLQAEFENYKKMAEKERKKIIQYANENLITRLLDVYENLERAIENGRKAGEVGPLMEGVEMTYSQLKDILENEGLSPIKAVGEKFDPFKHEAVLKENKDGCEEGIIIEELQRGYCLKDKVIRYSKVKVCKR
jgi:molecular chaperone GrpE